MRLQLSCPLCSKPLELESESAFGSEKLKVYKCGHAFSQEQLSKIEGNLDFSSVDGKKHAYNYQQTGVEFIIDSDFSCVIADQMRLGKTPQSLLALKNSPDKFPCLILVRSANIWQWKREVATWVGTLPNQVWVCQGTKNWIPPGFKIYIMSMDTFSRRGTCRSCKHQYHDEDCKRKDCTCHVAISNEDGMSDLLLTFGFKLVIADEAHSFKNTDSQRSQALVAFLKNIERSTLTEDWNFSCPFCKDKPSWTEQVTINVNNLDAHKKTYKTSHCPKCFCQVTQSAAAHVKVTRNCGIVMLTGTPIKNRADEYFVPLNLIAPERFPSLTHFRRKWLMQDGKGRWSRVAPTCFDAFKKEIAPFVLRREKEDVYTDCPRFNRIFTVIEVMDERLKKAYNKVLDDIEAKHPTGNFEFFNSIGELQQLRQICGLAKVQWVADYAETFLLDSDKLKLAIGVHHHSVRDAMKEQLANLGVCKLDGTDSAYQKDFIAHKYFEKAPEQLLLLGMMAAKEGIELPYIDTALVMEREWTSTEEEQFEFRFYNPSKDYLKSRGLNENRTTTIEYIIAKGTIDSFLYDLVEEKRAIFGETISNNWSLDQDGGSFRELMERTLAGRL